MCRASTKEWAINKFLYNYTDAAALQIVAKVLGQRALQVRGGVYLNVKAGKCGFGIFENGELRHGVLGPVR